MRFWTSRFDHFSKRQRTNVGPVETRGGIEYRFLEAPSYNRNISFGRIRHNIELGRSFRAALSTAPVADVTVCSMPTIELASESVRHRRLCGGRVFLDIRDAWPDALARLAPASLRWAAALAISPLDRKLRSALVGADGILAPGDGILDWALSKAGRSRATWDRVIYHGYPRLASGGAGTSTGIAEDSRPFTVLFIGTMSRMIEGDTLAGGIAGVIRRSTRAVRFVLVGEGEIRARLQHTLESFPEVTFTGRVGASEISRFLREADVGLLPYPSTADFIGSIPNKVGEYLSEGLAVVSSLDGDTARLLAETGAGRTYRNGDAADFAETVLHYLNDAPALARARNAAYELFDAHFDSTQVYGSYADHITLEAP